MPDPILPATLILPEKTLQGRGAITGLLPECARFGDRGVLLHGNALASSPTFTTLLRGKPATIELLTLRHQGGEPTLAQLSDLLSHARTHRAQWIAGIGGGSVIDLAKAGAALIHTTLPPSRYHDGAPLDAPGIPFLAAPTTAGTGSEATINSVLTNESTGAKKSIRAPAMMPRVVILDPALLSTCPPAVIAASGMDALTQAIEACTSRHATWFSNELSLKAMNLIAANLPAVYRNPAAEPAAHLLTGSYLAGIALSFARLGIVHGLAHPLGSLYHLPHGLVCAACLPPALELNRESFGAKYALMSTAVGGDLRQRVTELSDILGIGTPFAGMPCPAREQIIAETLASGSTKANPKTIARQDVEWILTRLFAPR
jgi:alcohol dehydrogenase class IV